MWLFGMMDRTWEALSVLVKHCVAYRYMAEEHVRIKKA